ncbi:hypothetical protein HC174_14925 [Salinimicrobium sp. CDJ15-81-2]|nr:hypothetical protein [Salinimicrobium nanhaiense]
MNTAKAILPATFGLLKEISGKADFRIISAFKNAILSFGSKADADELLQHFLQNPTDPYAGDLLEVIGSWGDSSHAEKIFRFSISDGRLHENFPETVLEILGQLGYEPAKPVLAHYAFNSPEYYLNKAAVLGLLHFDCKEYREEIRNSIVKVLDKNLFPEYLPALICKLEDCKELLEQLYRSGATIISTDCNAGIFLGFSLCGDEGRSYFKNALFDPNWEAFYNAARTIVQGMTHLNITFEELMQEAGEIKDEKQLQYYMLVILSLLEIKADSHESKGESFEKLYRNLIATGHLTTLAEKAGQLHDAESVEKLLILRMKEEVILRNKR